MTPSARRAALLLCVLAIGCERSDAGAENDVMVLGQVYTLDWPDPAPDGTPSDKAPRDSAGLLRPDAEAIVVRDGQVVYVGTKDSAQRLGAKKVVQLGPNQVLIPGLVDAHTHAGELGANLARVDLVGIENEAAAVAKVVERAKSVPKGEWILGTGWDEGAWANHYPSMALLSERVPDHPVYLRGLHGFAAWGNRMAFEKAGITRDTKAPSGGEILHDARGEPTGIVTNSAVAVLAGAIPPATVAQTRDHLREALGALVAGGYTAIHEASVGATELAALQSLADSGALPLRVFVWLDGRDTALLREWRGRGPDTDDRDNLVVRSVKVFADGALGSRGARLLVDYADKPGHRGITGGAYGYDPALMEQMMRGGFQAVIHAIGDAANRETLDFYERVGGSESGRHRIEHAQVVSLSDIPRFAKLGVIASMQPSHAVEDMPWAEQRVGAERIKGAYAWRSLRMAGARLVFSSDLPATKYDISYGLHSAITRMDPQGAPAGGWRAHERMTAEEAIRAFTTWAAYAAFDEQKSGIIARGHRADFTVLSVDPFRATPEELRRGASTMTIVNGTVVYPKSP